MLLLGPIALHDKAPPGIIEVSSHVRVGAKLKFSKDKEERGR
jgi:hypothetical protein